MKDKTLFTREPHQVFPLATESGAISWRQSLMDGLYTNRHAMGKMAQEQLKDLFPVSHSSKPSSPLGYKQRSMVSGQQAGSSLVKAFKGK